MSGWHNQALLGWDTETTGVSVEQDRIVTAALVWIRPGVAVQTDHWVINPGVPIPQAATDVHGITTEHAAVHGVQPSEALDEIADNLADALRVGIPIVGMNCPYDLTLLDRELRRHALATVEERLGGPIAPVVDVMVLDRCLDKYRRGKRQLADLCAHYAVPIDGAHDCQADALAACRVAWRIAQRNPKIAGMSLAGLHELQMTAKAEQAASFADYLRRQGKPADDVRGEWPILPYAGAVVAAS